jgi:hypothetical protein
MGDLIYAYDPSLGEDIRQAAKEAAHYAADEDQEIALLFNGVVVRIEQYDKPVEVEKRYNQALANLRAG